MADIREDIKTLLLAGLGAACEGVDKAREKMDNFAKKGAEALEKGKTLNEELKHNIQAKVDEVIPHAPKTPEEIDAWLDALSEEERARILEKLRPKE